MEKFTMCKICSGQLSTENQKYDLAKCADCELVFCRQQFTQEEFIAVYNRLYNSENAVYSQHSVAEFAMLQGSGPVRIGRKRSAIIEENVLRLKVGSVLEIGSGIGLIGSYLKQKAPSIQYKGIEIDEESYRKSQTLGLDTINADFTAIGLLEQSVDIIMLWEVIEHLQDLKQFLDLSFTKLKPGGKILLSTPNYNKIHNYRSRAKDAIYQDAPPIHLNFFTTDNLKKIFRLSGYEDIRVSVKRFPFFKPTALHFYRDLIKALMSRYNGSALYLTAVKK